MIRTKSALSLLLLLCASAALASAATTGALVDRQGRAIAGAKVRALPFETEEAVASRLATAAPEPEPLASATSDSKGRFSLEVDLPYFRIFIEAAGYVPLVDRAERNESIGALLLEPGELVTVTLDGEGKPVAGAIVRATGQEVRTDDAGKAVLSFHKGGGGTIRIVHRDWAPLTRNYMRASQLPKTIALSRGVAVRGTVETTAGEPAAGAAISVDGFRAALSGEDGTFLLSHAPSDWKQLLATRGDDIAIVSRSSAAGYRLRLTKGAALSGTVLDAKTQMPVAGAPVSLTEDRPGMFVSRDGFTMPPQALTDAKGRFRISPVIPGTYGVSASRLGYDFTSVTVELKGGDRADKTITGQPLARIAGTVVDEERKPVGAAAVTPRADEMRRQFTFGGGVAPPSPRMFRAMVRPSWSSAEGEWVVREAPVDRDTKLEAVRPGLPHAESDAMRLTAGERKERVVLVIPRGITVSGTVSSRGGAPLANATVQAGRRDAGPQQSGVVTIVRRVGGPAEVSDGVTTGADGAFTMQLASGTYDLTADADGYAPESVRGVDVKGTVDPIAFELGESASVSGRVVRADGSGVPDVSVSAMSGASAQAITGPDGSFTLDELPPGSLTLMALKTSDYIRETVTVEAPASDVEIRIPAGGTIRGRVLEKGTKKPVTDFRAGPSGERRGAGMRMIMPSILQPFRSEDGSFELMNVPVGQTEIVAEAAGYVTATAQVSVEEGKVSEEVTILLEAGTRVFGRVTSPEGTPLSGASVSLVVDADETVPMIARRSSTATTDANGEYTLAGIEPGERSFRAAHESWPLLVKEANVSGRELRLDLQFPRGTDVTGSVVREGGAPVAGAMVSASTALQEGTSKAATTDANGNFRIEGLTPGRYNFFVRAEGISESLRDVDIATSGPIRIVIKAGGTITGRVTGLQPSEISTANVNASSSGGYASAPVRSDGTFRVEGAPAGTVRVTASTGSGMGSRRQTAPKSVEVTAGGETFVDLDFSSGNRVSGRVTRGGTPVDGARVSFQPKGGSVSLPGANLALTNSRGEYTVEGLEDGTYSVFVMDSRLMSSHRTEYTVSGGGTFDIQMSAAALRGRVIDRATEEGISGASVALDSTQESIRLAPIQTDASGGFRMEGVSPGSYRLRATRNGYGQEVVDVSIAGDADQDVEVRMSKSDGVEIRVVDRRDGRALRAFVSAADVTGRLALEEMLGGTKPKLSLAPGAYRVAISVSGYAPTVIDVRSPGGPYTVALTPGGSLRIESSSSERRRARIVDSSGRPIVRGRITVPSEMTFDAAGATVTGIEPGGYALEVLDAAGGVAARQAFTIVEGQTTTIRI